MSSLPKLEALIKIEATIWINSKGKYVSLPLEEFYALARTHEWTRGDSKDDVTHASATSQANSTKLSKQVEELTHNLSEEERLLFNLMTVSGWKSSEMTPKLYPLFQITKGDNNKYQLEMLPPPESVSLAVSSPNSVSPTRASKVKIATVPRSEVIRNMYVQSKKYAALVNDSSQPDLQSWWRDAFNSAQMILDHRKLNAKKINTKTVAAEVAKNVPASAAIINTNDETLLFAGKKMTLEERVRAKSQLRNKSSSTSTVDKTLSATTSRQSEEKALLELADALRSFSHRRGGNGSNAARLSMSDFMKDANVAWNAIVHNESVDKTTGKKQLETSRAIATPVTSIDLSRVLFHLRIKMSCGAGSKGVDSGDASNKRQMENYLLELLKKLASAIPNWIHLRSIPSSLSTTTKERKSKKPAPTITQQNAVDRKSMRNAIIVIRNDGLDYAKDVRAKLGGRTHQSSSIGGTVLKGDKKRSLKEFMGQHNAAAGAIVPPSFLKRYDKMLKE